jgi:hypothetical protein
MGITTDMIEDWESESLIEAIGNCIELNDLFLERYCNQEFRDLMRDIPEYDREFVLMGIDVKCQFNGFPPSGEWQHIWLDISEIEFQFEGDPADVFEDPEDFTIDGDLAYLYVGYGLSINYDIKQLKESVRDYKENYQNEN